MRTAAADDASELGDMHHASRWLWRI